MKQIINMCIMYRFYTYYKYIIIIFYLFWLKLEKWFNQEQWEIFSMINMNDRQNEDWTASPLRPKSGSNTLLHCIFSFCRLLFLKT